MPDRVNYDRALKSFENRFWYNKEESQENYWFNQYVEFSRFIQSIFISENGYITDTGNFENVNLELMYRIKEKVEKHPHLFSKFFTVA